MNSDLHCALTKLMSQVVVVLELWNRLLKQVAYLELEYVLLTCRPVQFAQLMALSQGFPLPLSVNQETAKISLKVFLQHLPIFWFVS